MYLCLTIEKKKNFNVYRNKERDKSWKAGKKGTEKDNDDSKVILKPTWIEYF